MWRRVPVRTHLIPAPVCVREREGEAERGREAPEHPQSFVLATISKPWWWNLQQNREKLLQKRLFHTKDSSFPKCKLSSEVFSVIFCPVYSVRKRENHINLLIHGTIFLIIIIIIKELSTAITRALCPSQQPPIHRYLLVRSGLVLSVQKVDLSPHSLSAIRDGPEDRIPSSAAPSDGSCLTLAARDWLQLQSYTIHPSTSTDAEEGTGAGVRYDPWWLKKKN